MLKERNGQRAMSSRRCGLCSKGPRRRLQTWSDSCVNRVNILSASRFTRQGRETMASVGTCVSPAATGNERNVAWYKWTTTTCPCRVFVERRRSPEPKEEQHLLKGHRAHPEGLPRRTKSAPFSERTRLMRACSVLCRTSTSSCPSIGKTCL